MTITPNSNLSAGEHTYEFLIMGGDVNNEKFTVSFTVTDDDSGGNNDYTIYVRSDGLFDAATGGNNLTDTLGAAGLTYSDGVLTMDNFSFTTSAPTAMKISSEATIHLIGTSSLVGGNNDAGSCYGLWSEANLIIGGNGSLSVTAGSATVSGAYSCGVLTSSVSGSANKNFTIRDSASLTAVAGTAPSVSNGLFCATLAVQDSATINATGNNSTVGSSHGISGNRLDMSGGTITATAGDSAGFNNVGFILSSTKSDSTFTGGSITAQCGSAAGEGKNLAAIRTLSEIAGLTVKGGAISGDSTVLEWSNPGYKIPSGDVAKYAVMTVTPLPNYTIFFNDADGYFYKNNVTGGLVLDMPQGLSASNATGAWVIMMDNVNFTTNATTALQTSEGVTINLIGTNSLTCGGGSAGDGGVAGLSVEGALTFTGGGSLSVTTGDANGNAGNGSGRSNMGIYAASVTIGAGLTVTAGASQFGPSMGILAPGGLTMTTGGSLTATSGTVSDSNMSAAIVTTSPIAGEGVTVKGGANSGDSAPLMHVAESTNCYVGEDSKPATYAVVSFPSAAAITGITANPTYLPSSGGAATFTVEGTGLSSGITVTAFYGSEVIATGTTTGDTAQTVSLTFPANTSTTSGKSYVVKASLDGGMSWSEKTYSMGVQAASSGGTVDPGPTNPGGGSSSTTTTIPADTESKSTPVEITTSGNDVTLKLPDSKVEAIIKSADENVTFDLSKVKNAETAIIPIKAVESLSEENIGITVKLPEAEITIAPSDLKDLADDAKTNESLRVEAEYISPSNLTAAQKAAVEGKRVIDINVFLGNRKVDVPVTVSIPYELADGEDPAGVCVWYMDDKGNLTKMTGSYDTKTGLFTFYTDHQSYYLIGYEQPENHLCDAFTDIKGHWGFDAICYMIENGIMNGTSSTTFAPNTNLSRAMMVQILWNLEGKPTAGSAVFVDVAHGAWYNDAVAWASASGIVNGYGNDKFGPEDSITREQMVTILRNYAEFKGMDVSATNDLGSFGDAGAVSGWALSSIQWAVEEEIIGGKPGGLIDPKGTATRAEIAQMMMNFMTKMK